MPLWTPLAVYGFAELAKEGRFPDKEYQAKRLANSIDNHGQEIRKWLGKQRRWE